MQNETFGTRLAKCRKDKKLTQEELGEKLGVSPQAVSKWENDSSMPDSTLLPKIADCLSVTIDELFKDKTDDKLLPRLSSEVSPQDKILHISVIDDDTKISVNLPFALLHSITEIPLISAEISKKLEQTKNLNLSEIISLVENGVTGEIVSIEDGDNTRISIWVE